MEKVGGAGFMAFAASLIMGLVILLAGAFLVSQVWIAFEAMIAKVALAVGVLPGPGRSWLWARALSILRALAVMVVSVLALAVLIVVVRAVMDTPASQLKGGLIVRFVLVDTLAVAGFVFRKRLLRGTRSLAQRAQARLGGSILGGAGPPNAGGGGRRSGLGRTLATAGLLAGAMALTGGGAGAAGRTLSVGSLGSGSGVGRAGASALGARLAGRGLRHAGRGLAHGVGHATSAGAKTAAGLARFGWRAGPGLPVYGPRALRRLRTAADAGWTSAHSRTQALQQRLHQAAERRAGQAREFADEYRHNVRSGWSAVRGNGFLPTYTPPTPGRGTGVGRQRPGAAGAAGARRRPAPPRTPTAPASSRQAALHQRLHRMRTPGARRPPATPPTLRPPDPRQGGRDGGDGRGEA